MKGRIGDTARLKHILDAIIEIESYLLHSEFTDFMDNSMMRFACIKQLEIIGEASNHVSDATKQKFADIEWARITGMRNILVHEYFGVDEALVWDILKNDIPELKSSLEVVLEALKD